MRGSNHAADLGEVIHRTAYLFEVAVDRLTEMVDTSGEREAEPPSISAPPPASSRYPTRLRSRLQVASGSGQLHGVSNGGYSRKYSTA
jgi:hypothetical protein